MADVGARLVASGRDHACAAPTLVGTGSWYPADASSRAADARGVVGACARLVCEACGAPVTSTLAHPARRYACACVSVDVLSPRPAYWPGADESLHAATRWRCAGHPALRWDRAPRGVKEGEDAVAALGIVGPEGERLTGARAWAWLYAALDVGERDLVARWAAQAARRGAVADLAAAVDFYFWVPACPHDAVLLEVEAAVLAASRATGESAGASLWHRWVEAVMVRWIRARADRLASAPWRERALDLALRPPGLGAWVRVIEREEPAWYAEHRGVLA